MRRPDLSVGGRLGLAFGAVALLLAVLAGGSLHLLDGIRVQTQRYMDLDAPRLEAVDRLEAEALYLAVAVRAYMIWPQEPRRLECERQARGLREALAEIERVPRDPEGAAPPAAIHELTEAYLARASALVESVRAGRASREEQVQLGVAREALLVPLRDVSALTRKTTGAEISEIAAAQERTRQLLLAVVLAVAAAFVATVVLATRAISRPALALVEATRRVAGGDWVAGAALAPEPGDVRPRRDELAELTRAFGRMSVALRDREEQLAAQNEELQSQNEEIQAQSEELQSQSEEIQAQSEELQIQSEEIRAQNEELLGHNEELAAQGDELRRAKAAVERNERRFRLLFDNLSEGFALHEVVHAPDGSVDYRFLEVNPAFERITGLARERTVGRTVREVLPGIEQEWIDRYARVVATGEPIRFASFAAPLGKHFDVLAFRPEPGQFATLFVDDTDRWRAEAGLVDADRRKNEFLAVLSHELRNPLAPIQNALQLLDQAGDEERSRRARAVMTRQVAHLARLVEDLLDVTRISRGKVELRREHVDFGAVVSHAAEDNASILEAAGVRLDVRVPLGQLLVNADPTRLAQVVENLLQNAAKFTPSGGRVTVLLEKIAPARAALRVRDTGIGISPDVHQRLFEPFMQGELSLARTSGGLGLGLALVKGLVELHGGTVRAASDGAGLGAELTVELPLAGEGPVAAVVARPAAARQRILLIEDNVDGAETLRDILALAGHRVEIAFDGASGLERAGELRPDAVLCDVGLPDLDGYEVARRMRANPALERTLLVALTGYALPEDQRRAVDAGFDAHLAKPTTLDAIEALLAGAQRVGARN